MPQDDVVVAVFATHDQADAAIKKLASAGFATKHLSLVGKGYHTEETVTGFYNFGDRVKFWGSRGAIASIGVPEDSVLQYETAIKADDFLVMAHGDLADVERARGILAAMKPKQIKLHLLAQADQMATA